MTDEGMETAHPRERHPVEPKERPQIALVEAIGENGDQRQQVVGLGFEITEPNDPFDVKDSLFSENRFDLAEPIKTVYLETDDGNIFRLLRNDDGDGFLQDANLTAESYKANQEHGTYQGYTLEDPHLLDRITIEVGKPFDWGTFTTSNVTKLTAVIDHVGDPASVDTQGRQSSVAQRFGDKSHPKPETQG